MEIKRTGGVSAFLGVILILLAPAGAASEQAVYSDIAVEQFTGEVILTFPDGTGAVLEPGLPVPSVPSGSGIEVATGRAVLDVMRVKIAVMAGSAVKIYNVDELRGRFHITALKGSSELFAGLSMFAVYEGDDIIVRIDLERMRVTIIRNGRLEAVVSYPALILDSIGDEPDEPEPVEASPFMP